MTLDFKVHFSTFVTQKVEVGWELLFFINHRHTSLQLCFSRSILRIELCRECNFLHYITCKIDSSLFFVQSCSQKVAVLNPANNQIISLSTLYTWSGCKEVTENGVTKVKCTGGRTFRSSRERWWFIAISRCDPGSTVRYLLHFDNTSKFKGSRCDTIFRPFSW